MSNKIMHFPYKLKEVHFYYLTILTLNGIIQSINNEHIGV